MIQVQIATILSSATSDPEWRWALKNLDDIQAAKGTIDDAMTTFGRKLMYEDLRELRKAYNDQVFILNTETFRQTMEPKICHAQTEAKRMLAMHKSRKV